MVPRLSAAQEAHDEQIAQLDAGIAACSKPHPGRDREMRSSMSETECRQRTEELTRHHKATTARVAACKAELEQAHSASLREIEAEVLNPAPV